MWSDGQREPQELPVGPGKPVIQDGVYHLEFPVGWSCRELCFRRWAEGRGGSHTAHLAQGHLLFVEVLFGSREHGCL